MYSSISISQVCTPELLRPVSRDVSFLENHHSQQMADRNNILRPVSTFSNKFRLYMFDGATSAEDCFAEPLK